jgi:poly-gamma-glutamate capsule biosynthesis protein CapA/YwtB (metallophosphatase superfamily)
LETVLVESGSTFAPRRGFIMLHGNLGGVNALLSAGVDVVTLAHNHVLDGGIASIDVTTKALDAAGIAQVLLSISLKAFTQPTPSVSRHIPLFGPCPISCPCSCPISLP